MTFAAFAALAVAGAFACAANARAETHVVPIRRMAFELPPAEVQVGDTIEWINEDSVPHTASSADAGFDATLAPGESARSTLSKPGRFDVTCRYHPGMSGVLRVR
jgi:plastocyanin